MSCIALVKVAAASDTHSLSDAFPGGRPKISKSGDKTKAPLSKKGPDSLILLF